MFGSLPAQPLRPSRFPVMSGTAHAKHFAPPEAVDPPRLRRDFEAEVFILLPCRDRFYSWPAAGICTDLPIRIVTPPEAKFG